MKSSTSDTIILQVDGRLEGPDVDMLAREGDGWRGRGSQLVLDVAGLRDLDARGVALLETWSRQGVELREASMYLRALLQLD